MNRPFKLPPAFWLLFSVHLLVVFAGFLAPYGYQTQDRSHPFAQPSGLHWVDCNGKFHLRPLVYVPQREAPQINNQDGCARLFPLRLLVHGDTYTILGIFPGSLHLFGVDSPDRFYLLGSDGFGRDMFSRMFYGGQVSLFAGLVAACLSLLTGLLVGAVAGLYGGWVDEVAMRLAEVFIAMPALFLLLALRAFLPLHMGPVSAFVLVVSVFGVLSWGRPARLVRGIVLSARERTFVLAARGFGASNWYLLRRHLMPLASGVMLTQMTLLVPQFILAEVVLSFLGLGVSEPFPTWGNLLAYAQQYHVLVSYWWMLLPGVAPIPVFLAYHALADGFQEQLQSKNLNRRDET